MKSLTLQTLLNELFSGSEICWGDQHSGTALLDCEFNVKFALCKRCDVW